MKSRFLCVFLVLLLALSGCSVSPGPQERVIDDGLQGGYDAVVNYQSMGAAGIPVDFSGLLDIGDGENIRLLHQKEFRLLFAVDGIKELDGLGQNCTLKLMILDLDQMTVQWSYQFSEALYVYHGVFTTDEIFCSMKKGDGWELIA